jgi:hypothetical protein
MVTADFDAMGATGAGTHPPAADTRTADRPKVALPPSW